ncbi:MAG: aconitate hydratase AcnA [Gemmatimonadales bacterium]
MTDPLNAKKTMPLGGADATVFSLRALVARGIPVEKLPYSIRILLENVLRHAGNGIVDADDVDHVGGWTPAPQGSREVPYMPSRVVLQDFTGVPGVVDLAALRDAMVRLGGDSSRINPLVPTDLVIDHSVQVDFFGTPTAFRLNVEREMERNGERYQLLRWAQQAFDNFRVVPPGTGIVHQVNLEYLASVVGLAEGSGVPIAFPDTLVGTDSHTTMINGIGVMGWGVGGIEAEAVMLGQPYFMKLPQVVGMKFVGKLPDGATATDLVLHVTEVLRRAGVVGKFVEFFGPGLSHLGLADRATIANMAPEYGATMGFFPVDTETLVYLRGTGRSEQLVDRVEGYCKEQLMFHTSDSPDPEYSDVLEMDLSTVAPSLAGPKRPQDRVALADIKDSFSSAYQELIPPNARRPASRVTVGVERNGSSFDLTDGSVVIAAITSCTNTSNPSVMIGAGLVARNAIKRGLKSKPWVKTSMAPGSKVVTEYLNEAKLTADLEALGFHTVGYGCTTCIGNSGPLPEDIATAITDNELVASAVLSGNRNFEARIHPQVRANYLASPMLVVAYALAGRIDIDFSTEPLGQDATGENVFLKDIWPTPSEVSKAVAAALKPEMFESEYASVFEGDATWQKLPVPQGEGGRFAWDSSSTYVAEPPFFQDISPEPAPVEDIVGARVLAWLGDTTTTDHISPAGAIPKDGPAGRWLIDRGVEPVDFNTFGSRRGHHDVMVRGTFGNVRIKNRLADRREGGWTRHFPTDEILSIYEAAERYIADNTPLLVLAGVEYGTGSSRDWAAKGTMLLGVRAVIAESYERIHRSNLIGMGVLPLQFQEGQSAESLGLTGREEFSIAGVADADAGGSLQVAVKDAGGNSTTFGVLVRLDTSIEVDYYRHGGILPYVLRQLL